MQYLTLKRSGRNFKGLCPFHHEKTPSFMVNPERGIYHCFGCSEGGDIFAFVMKMEGLDFPGALNMLAAKAGVDLAQYGRGQAENKNKAAILDVLELSAKYYQASLSKNQPALEYATKERKFSQQTLEEWRVGYAPIKGDALTSFLLQRGHQLEILKLAGLVAGGGRQPNDLFRGRLLIPLANPQGQVIGFVGRKVEESTFGPKYLNSPQTIVYDKSRHIFGLHLAKSAIRTTDKAVLVEGNLDVLSSHQAGVKNVVATAGTALALEQLRQLARLASTLVLAFDNDQAGLTATIRAVHLAQKINTNLVVAPLVGGKDPDELIGKNPADWQKALDGAVYAIDWLFEHFQKQFSGGAQGKKQLKSSLLPLVEVLSDPVEREHYQKQLAKELDVSLEAVIASSQQAATPPPKRFKADQFQKTKDEEVGLIDSYLSLIANYPETHISLEGLNGTKLGDQRQAVFDYIRESNPSAALDPTARPLQEVADFVKILAFRAEQLYGDWEPSERVIESISLAARLGHNSKIKQLRDLSQKIKSAEDSDDQQLVANLLTEYQTLLAKE